MAGQQREHRGKELRGGHSGAAETFHGTVSSNVPTGALLATYRVHVCEPRVSESWHGRSTEKVLVFGD